MNFGKYQFKYNLLAKFVTAFPLAFISIQLLILVIVQVIPAFNLENAMNFAREIFHLYYKYCSILGLGFFFVEVRGGDVVGF